MRTTAELREGFLSFFEEKGPPALPVGLARPARRRPLDAAHDRRHAAADAVLPRPRAASRAADDDRRRRCFRTPSTSTRSGSTATTSRSSRCSATSRSGSTSRRARSSSRREFVQERMQLDWDRVWVTVHAGDPQLKLGPDEVAIELWKKVGMPRERIVPLPTSENFWSVGGPGPCGPDSEIYWDWGEEHGCGEPDCAPGCTRCERFLEFWNLVFMEYEQHAGRHADAAPEAEHRHGARARARRARSSRTCRPSTRRTATSRSWTGSPAESGVAYGDSPAATKAHRILADHGRGMTFLVGDGVTPSNEGRGYVLRRIIRRAVAAGAAHRPRRRPPAVRRRRRADGRRVSRSSRAQADEIERVVRLEEERFSETLERGLKLFEELGGAGGDLRRAGVHARRDLRLPARADGRARRGARPGRRRRRLPRRDGAAPRDLARRRARGELQRAADFARDAGFATEFVGYAKTDVLTQIGALEDARGRPLPREAARVAVLPGGRRPGDRRGHDRARRRLGHARRARRGVPLRATTRRSLFRGSGFAAGDRVRARRAVARALPDDGEPHGHAPPPPGAARGARRARPAGRLGRAARQAPLRLHARQRADGRGARGGRAARERDGLREPSRFTSSRRRSTRRATSAR